MRLGHSITLRRFVQAFPGFSRLQRSVLSLFTTFNPLKSTGYLVTVIMDANNDDMPPELVEAGVEVADEEIPVKVPITIVTGARLRVGLPVRPECMWC